MSDLPKAAARPLPETPLPSERAAAVDLRLTALFRKHSDKPLMDELRKAVRSHILERAEP